MKLEVVVNDPFDAAKIKHLFSDRGDLQLAAPRSHYPFDEDQWAQRFGKHPENCSLLFYLNDQVVGHTSFLPTSELLYLCYVILLPELRGKSVATEMIRLSEEFCRLNYPHEVLHLNVNKGNDRARRLYEKLGYVKVDEIKDKVKMMKRLYST